MYTTSKTNLEAKQTTKIEKQELNPNLIGLVLENFTRSTLNYDFLLGIRNNSCLIVFIQVYSTMPINLNISIPLTNQKFELCSFIQITSRYILTYSKFHIRKWDIK